VSNPKLQMQTEIYISVAISLTFGTLTQINTFIIVDILGYYILPLTYHNFSATGAKGLIRLEMMTSLLSLSLALGALYALLRLCGAPSRIEGPLLTR